MKLFENPRTKEYQLVHLINNNDKNIRPKYLESRFKFVANWMFPKYFLIAISVGKYVY